MTATVGLGSLEDITHVRSALASGGAVVVLARDLVAPASALTPITDDPFAPSTLLTAPDPSGLLTVRHHMVVSAGSDFHRLESPDRCSVGALLISSTDAARGVEAIDRLVAAWDSGQLAVSDSAAFDVLVVSLVRGGVPMRSVDIVDVPWFRAPDNIQAARQEVDSVSEGRVRGLLANRVDDGFYSTFVVRKASKPLTRVAISAGWSPNAITMTSFFVGLAAAASFAIGSWWWLLLGAVLLQVSLVIDCVDGEVARATRRFSAVGAWLDASTDRVKEFAAYAGLAIGAARFGVNLWWIAVVLIVLQTSRHVSDYDFSRIQRLREASAPIADICEPEDPLPRGRGALAEAMETSARANRTSAVRWLKKVLHMPIGERWLLLSVLAVVGGARWALVGLLIAGLMAFSYVTVGRIARTFTWSGPTPSNGSSMLQAQCDAGPVASLVARALPALRPRLIGRFAWSAPVLLRVLELMGITLVIAVSQTTMVVLVFWMLFVIAFHHYDNLYRSLQGAEPPRWLTWAGLGWDGRLIVIGAVALTTVWEPTTTLLVIYLAVLFGGVASVQWLRSMR